MYEPTTTGTSTTGTSGCFPGINNCIHRLPCGLCTYLRTICPLGNIGTPMVTWGEVTCDAGDKEKA